MSAALVTPAVNPTPAASDAVAADLNAPSLPTSNNRASQVALRPTGAGSLGLVPSNNPGTARVGASSQSGGVTVAQLIPAALRPRELLGRWLGAIERPTFSPRVGSLPASAVRVPVPASLVPLRPTGQRNPLGHVFSGGQMRAAEGLPQWSGAISETALPIIESALTEARLAQFDRLSPERQEVARGLLSAAVDGLQKPPWSESRIAVGDFDAVVDLIFERVAQWQAPSAETSATPALPNPAVSAGPLPSPMINSALPVPATSSSLPNPATGTPPLRALLVQRLQGVNSVETLLNTPTRPSGGNFRVDTLTRDEIVALDAALRTPEGKSRLLSPSPNTPLKERFLSQSLAEQVNPSLVDPQAQQRNLAALNELADNPTAGESASVKIGYRYVQDQPGGAVYREAVYTQIGQQLAVSPGLPAESPPFTATTTQAARLYGDTVLREFNNALQRPIEPNQPSDPAQIQVLQNPEGNSGQIVQTDRASLADRFTSLLDTAGPRVQAFNRVLNVVNPVVLAVGAGKTIFDFTQGRVIPRFNDAEAAKLFNLPKGMFVASVTLRSSVAGVPTTYTAYVALGASRDVALLPGQQGGLPRAQIGTNPFTGRRTIGLLSTFNRSALEIGAGGNVGTNNLAVMSTNSIRVGVIAGNPLRGQLNLPDAPTNPGANPDSGLSVSGGTAVSAQGVQVSSLTGLRLGPAVYGRRIVVPIRYVAQASTETQTRGIGRNFSLGGFSVSRLDAKSDAFVITVNPAFDAAQIQQLIDATKQAGNPSQLEGVLQQLERLGAIVRSSGR